MFPLMFLIKGLFCSSLIPWLNLLFDSVEYSCLLFSNLFFSRYSALWYLAALCHILVSYHVFVFPAYAWVLVGFYPQSIFYSPGKVCQSIAGPHTDRRTPTQLRVTNQPMKHVFDLWEETRGHG